MRLTTPQHWQAQWNDAAEIPTFPFFDEVARHLPRCPGASFLEIGCAPGGILAQFCSALGYVAHGIDYVAEPATIEGHLRKRGVLVGQITRGDFLEWCPGRTYDVVASFGFVEHFAEPASVVDRHFALVRPGGHVVVTLPNFARGQWLLHRLFDPVMLEGHNLRCMNLGFLRSAATRNHARLLSAGYAGGQFAFWRSEARRSRLQERVMWRTVGLLKRLCKRLPAGTNPLFSPYLVAVYQSGA